MNAVVALVSVVVASILLLILFCFAQIGFGSIAGFESLGALTTADVIRVLVLVFGTVFGVVSRGLYDEIDSSKTQRISIGRVIRSASSSKSFWMGILISPILILAFYETVGEIRSDFLVAIMAYQNGFFFRSVMASRGEKKQE